MDKTSKIALILAAKDQASAVLNKAFANAEKHVKSLEKTSASISKMGNNLLIAGGISTAFFGKTIADARESVKANARLEQVYKSMGETTGKAAKEAEDFAGKLQFKIGFEDEAIQAAQAKLATFQSLITQQARDAQIFNRATQLTFDLQAAGFGEASQNAVQLGKALEDPVKGLNALRRSGITFTDAEKKKIAALVATNKKLEAQKIILAAVEKQVGDVAEATADPIAKMNIAVSEASESIGKVLYPVVTKLANAISAWMPGIQQFIENHKRLVKLIAIGGPLFLGLGAAFKVVAFAISGYSTAIKAAIAVQKFFNTQAMIKQLQLLKLNFMQAQQFIGLGFDYLKIGVKAVANAFVTGFKAISNAVVTAGRFLLANPIILIITAIAVAAFLIIKYWTPIKEFFIRLWDGVKSIFNKAIAFVKKLFLNFTPLGLIIKYWQPITQWFSNMWEKVKHVFTAAWEWVKNLGSKFWEAGKNIVNSIWEGIKSMINKPIDAIKDMVSKIRDFLPFSPAKVGPLKTLHKVKIAETIATAIKPQPVVNAMQKLTGKAYDVVNNPAPVYNTTGGDMHFNLTVHLNGGATQSDAQMLSKEVQKQMDIWYRNKMQNQQRLSY